MDVLTLIGCCAPSASLHLNHRVVLPAWLSTGQRVYLRSSHSLWRGCSCFNRCTFTRQAVRAIGWYQESWRVYASCWKTAQHLRVSLARFARLRFTATQILSTTSS